MRIWGALHTNNIVLLLQGIHAVILTFFLTLTLIKGTGIVGKTTRDKLNSLLDTAKEIANTLAVNNQRLNVVGL